MRTPVLGRGGGYPGAVRQVGHLGALRWSTLDPATRVVTGLGVVLLAAAVPAALAFGAVGAGWLPRPRLVEAVELTPGLLLVLAVGLLVSAIASSGGREILPRHQLVGYPLSPGAEHLASLLLTPANLAWTVQVTAAAVLVGLHAADTAAGAGTGPVSTTLAAGVLYLSYVAALTCLGQALAWVLELVRSFAGGTWAVRLFFLGLTAAAVLAVRQDVLVDLLSQAPTRVLTGQVEAFAGGDRGGWALCVAVLTAVAAAAGAGGAWLFRWLANRPARDQSHSETTRHRPRRLPAAHLPCSLLRAWRRQDWVMVLRSVPLRRGLLVLLVAPTVGALFARLPWTDLVLFTCVVGAGAGLLFGVNMFALDGEGAWWRESLPAPPRTWVLARTWVLTEVVLVTTVLTTVAAGVSARGTLTATTLLVTVLAVPTITGQVVSRCVAWSIDAPERAQLRTTRDAPLSPARMVAASARLMGATLGLAVVLSLVARLGQPWLVWVVLLPFWWGSASRLRSALRRWESHEVRARVVQTVARG